MKTEDALAQAMAAHVADVHASPSLGRAVRRRNHRFRTAGAAFVAVAAMAAVPTYLAVNAGSGSDESNAAAVVVQESVVVPDVVNMSLAKAQEALAAVGLVGAKKTGAEGVFGQEPKAGTEVDAGSTVELFLVEAGPNDLGDLGDGRAFAGIKLDYLPKDLVWSESSTRQDWHGGVLSFTSFHSPEQPVGYYAIQVSVYDGKAVKVVDGKLATIEDKGGELIDLEGKQAFLAGVGESGEMAKLGDDTGPEGGAAIVGFKLYDKLAVEVTISPDWIKQIGLKSAAAELKKIGEGISRAK